MHVNGASSTAKTIAIALLFILLLVPSAWFAWENRHMPQFGQAHDDAIYYIAAKSLADGQGYRIASLPQAPYETKYPPMLPWLLSVAWIVQPRFPENLAIATITYICFGVFRCLPSSYVPFIRLEVSAVSQPPRSTTYSSRKSLNRGQHASPCASSIGSPKLCSCSYTRQ